MHDNCVHCAPRDCCDRRSAESRAAIWKLTDTPGGPVTPLAALFQTGLLRVSTRQDLCHAPSFTAPRLGTTGDLRFLGPIVLLFPSGWTPLHQSRPLFEHFPYLMGSSTLFINVESGSETSRMMKKTAKPAPDCTLPFETLKPQVTMTSCDLQMPCRPMVKY